MCGNNVIPHRQIKIVKDQHPREDASEGPYGRQTAETEVGILDFSSALKTAAPFLPPGPIYYPELKYSHPGA